VGGKEAIVPETSEPIPFPEVQGLIDRLGYDQLPIDDGDIVRKVINFRLNPSRASRPDLQPIVTIAWPTFTARGQEHPVYEADYVVDLLLRITGNSHQPKSGSAGTIQAIMRSLKEPH
jgi:hypothetical protein